ncbi:HAMP domain-containing protein [Psychrobacillus antarcticus]|uniref:HAMP domain-containing protein n=1 Tax=Psychrobacillus antarcticus TaxID=2879115 RepID=UPI002407BA1D|nr:HAMP domain-containing protein [Psychrobacillus antarcticus]
MPSLFFTKSIIRPVDEMKSLMQEAEKGDLTVQSTYKSNDEIGILAASFNQMLLNLKGRIDRVRESSEQVAASS